MAFSNKCGCKGIRTCALCNDTTKTSYLDLYPEQKVSVMNSFHLTIFIFVMEINISQSIISFCGLIN